MAGTGQTKDHKLVLACYFVAVSFLCLGVCVRAPVFLFREKHTCILFIHVHILSVVFLIIIIIAHVKKKKKKEKKKQGVGILI